MSAASSPSPWEIVNDYTKTVVTVAAAFLAFTGTFATNDRLAAAPVWPLICCWTFLILAIAAALFSVGRLTGFLRGKRSSPTQCLVFANLSYFSLFLAVVAFMYFAVLAITQKQVGALAPHKGSVGFFSATASPPFTPGSPTEASGSLVEAVCATRETMEQRGSSTAIVIGRADRREISRAISAQVASNMGLAQQRAETIGTMLQNGSICKSGPVGHVVVTVGGPRHTDLKQYKTKIDRELALAEDRRVEVEGLQFIEANVTSAK